MAMNDLNKAMLVGFGSGIVLVLLATSDHSRRVRKRYLESCKDDGGTEEQCETKEKEIFAW